MSNQPNYRMYLHLFGSIQPNSSSFPPLRIFWAGVNTAIALEYRPNKCSETQLKRLSQSASKRTLVQLNVDDLKHTCGFIYSFWFTCKKGSVKANRTNIYLARIKASELVDFPGVNTPLETSPAQIFILLISF